MNPQIQLCPNPSCQARGQDGEIEIHSRKEQRYRCKRCGRTFSETYGTALYRVKKPEQVFVWVVTLLAYGCPVQAIVAAFGLDERTVWAWLQRAGAHCQQVHRAEIEQGQLDLCHIQADELKIKTVVGTVWIGMVMMVSTRLWLGGSVAASRSKWLLSTVFSHARRSGRAGKLLVAVDGLNLYLEVIPQVFGKTWQWLQARWEGWTEVAVVQTMKQKGGKRGRIDRQIAWGDPCLVRYLIRASQGEGWINSAYIERLNATFRARIAAIVRHGRQLLHQAAPLEAWMWLVGSVYNWCCYHDSLAIALPVSPRRNFWLKRTPAIAAGLTDHRWTIAELLCWKHPTGYGLRRRILGVTL